MPDAARISDFHTCPKVEPGPVPHVGGPIFSGSANIIVGFLPAARVGDSVVCFPVGPADAISQGSPTVVFNSRKAARKGDACDHGGAIARGCPTVIIGGSGQSFTFRAAARTGTPFCEECERRRREMEDRDDSAKPAESTTLDDDPPVGAVAGRDLLGTSTLDMVALARQADQGDGLDLERRAAKLGVAYMFYAGKNSGRVKPSKITSHLRGIDLSQPVEVVDVSSQTFYQRGSPGSDNGAYYSQDIAIPPEELGAAGEVYPRVDGVPTPPAVPRDRREVRFDATPALGLKSTAAPIDDDWSMPKSDTDPGKVVACKGGATQLMIPWNFHGSSTTRRL